MYVCTHNERTGGDWMVGGGGRSREKDQSVELDDLTQASKQAHPLCFYFYSTGRQGRQACRLADS